jgi:hypothetical protein
VAERGCQLSGNKDPAFLGALAAAYAEVGRFQEAVAAARKAEALAASLGYQQDVAQLRAQLQLYEAGQPYHAERKP